METSILITLIILISILIIVGVVLFLEISLPKKALLLVLLVMPGFLSYRSLNNLRGEPVSLLVSQNKIMVYKSYVPKDKSYLYLWVVENNLPKTIRLPYINGKTADQISRMLKAAKGKPVLVNLKVKKKNNINPFNKVVEEVVISTWRK